MTASTRAQLLQAVKDQVETEIELTGVADAIRHVDLDVLQQVRQLLERGLREKLLGEVGPLACYRQVGHFGEAPLLLLGLGKTRDGSGIYPAIWSAMLAARAEGIGSTLTGVLQTFKSDEVFDLLGVPKDQGWFLHGAVPMGYPTGRWGVAPRRPVHEVAARNGWNGDLGFTVADPLWPRRDASASSA